MKPGHKIGDLLQLLGLLGSRIKHAVLVVGLEPLPDLIRVRESHDVKTLVLIGRSQLPPRFQDYVVVSIVRVIKIFPLLSTVSGKS
jgi:hypothetical protein